MRRAELRQCGARIRPFDGERGDPVGLILQRDVVGDDVAIQMFVNFGPRLGLGVQQEVILEAQQIHVRQDAALGGQEEGVAALARLKRFHLVGGHRMQQPRPIFAARANLAAAGQIAATRHARAERNIRRSRSRL